MMALVWVTFGRVRVSPGVGHANEANYKFIQERRGHLADHGGIELMSNELS